MNIKLTATIFYQFIISGRKEDSGVRSPGSVASNLLTNAKND